MRIVAQLHRRCQLAVGLICQRAVERARDLGSAARGQLDRRAQLAAVTQLDGAALVARYAVVCGVVALDGCEADELHAAFGCGLT
jgi:hypothetical protein